MNIWKDLGKHGRHGDTMMKKIDGDLAHVNAIEYEMSPEYIKEHGAGTINPITGKKEYWGWVLPALSIGSAVAKGFGAMGNRGDIETGKTAAYDLYQEQLGLLGEERDIATGQIQSQYAAGGRELAFGLQAGQRDIAQATGKTNLAFSGTMQTKQEDLLAKHQSDLKKLVDTRAHASAQTDLRFREGEMSREQAYQDTLTQLESQPGGSAETGFGAFLEGAFT
tara:strand:- start:37 stop:705 length:669 start_codon:yes stop_codon:yes gene_type:complete